MLILPALLLGIPRDSEPRLRGAYGGVADFRGINNTIFNVLSAPNISLSMKTMDVQTLMPRPSLVNGSFFTEAFLTIQLKEEKLFASIMADESGFRMCDERGNTIDKKYIGIWKDFQKENVRILSKMKSVLVRASGWEMNITKTNIEYPIENQLKHRLHVSLTYLSDPYYTKSYGSPSKMVSPHGILGQTFDDNKLAVDGDITDYNSVYVEVTQQAKGFIEGVYTDYIVSRPFSTDFKYSRFYKNTFIGPRNVANFGAIVPQKPNAPFAEINDELGKTDYKRLVQ